MFPFSGELFRFGLKSGQVAMQSLCENNLERWYIASTTVVQSESQFFRNIFCPKEVSLPYLRSKQNLNTLGNKPKILQSTKFFTLYCKPLL